MTSQGTPYGRFRRALGAGNVLGALSAAGELEQIGLVDSLALVLLLRDKAPERFTRAAVRWHGRYCREVGAELEEAQAVLALLALLPTRKRVAASHALADLFDQRRLGQAAEILMRSAG